MRHATETSLDFESEIQYLKDLNSEYYIGRDTAFKDIQKLKQYGPMAASVGAGEFRRGYNEVIAKAIRGLYIEPNTSDVPRCPRCGSYKLTGICGHTWEIPSEG